MVLILMSCCSKLTFLIEISQRGCEFCPGVGTKGRLHEKKVAVLLDFVQISPPPPFPLISFVQVARAGWLVADGCCAFQYIRQQSEPVHERLCCDL